MMHFLLSTKNLQGAKTFGPKSVQNRLEWSKDNIIWIQTECKSDCLKNVENVVKSERRLACRQLERSFWIQRMALEGRLSVAFREEAGILSSLLSDSIQSIFANPALQI